jgi:hypothetical protein
VASFAKGWNTIWERKINHPAGLVESQEIAGALDQLLRPDAPAYRKQTSGVGSAKFVGDYFIGSACIKYECDQTDSSPGSTSKPSTSSPRLSHAANGSRCNRK